MIENFWSRARRLLFASVFAITNFVAQAAETYPWASLSPEEFLRQLEAIGTHGDLRDTDFIAATLRVTFDHRELVDDRHQIIETLYEPKGTFASATPRPFFYAIAAGKIPMFAYLHRPLMSSLQFDELQQFMCIRPNDINRIFQHYPELDIGITFPSRYGFNLYDEARYGINIEVYPATKMTAECIRTIDLYQSEWTSSNPRNRTSR